jgi:hypothetical protein
MPASPYCSSSDLTRDGRDQRGRVVYACRACGRHATSESMSLVAGHRFPRDIILLAVRYYLQLGTAAERIAGILADRGIDVSGRTIGAEVRAGSDQRDPPIQEAVEHNLAGGRDVREDPGRAKKRIERTFRKEEPRKECAVWLRGQAA